MAWLDKDEPKKLRSINNVLEFGKHKGKTVQQVMKEDPQWLHWALQNIPDFKLNRNALLLLPPNKPKQQGTIEDGDGGFLDNDCIQPESFNDYD